jgi:hypothetical protein
VAEPPSVEEPDLIHIPYRRWLGSKTVIPRTRRIETAHKKFIQDHFPVTIFGEWHFDCPGSADLWDEYQEEDIVWKIHRPETGVKGLWVEFHQVCVEGIILIDWDGSDDWRDKEIKFTFKGRETGEGYNNSGNGVIKFSSSHECSGHIDCFDIGGPWKFTGKKVSNKVPNIPVNRCRKLYKQGPFKNIKSLWEW